ncbi:nitroreductase family protein [Ornithinibacillus halotolerans]|uniref:Nitroreductase domain-containing protein n=1 Tax=Ornithinibacillus halotolerans TaxID=1274357 RepID=A0A916RQF5_9BACI|nr:nitroreductase family protein [Ornithinibacillus halotolerans]GGA66196.1 hypothetical protein GCM10008025_07540 [Ornithinibacillus halotolerans]
MENLKSNTTLAKKFALQQSINRYENQYVIPKIYGVKQPTPFKVYHHDTKKVPLHSINWRRESNIWELFFKKNNGKVNNLQMEQLSSFLFYAYGLLRFEILHAWELHRGVASARCLYPTDVYIAVPKGYSCSLEAGIYYYNPLYHELNLVRSGNWIDTILNACGYELEDSKELIVCTATNFGRTAFYYADFAYRLTSQEVGLAEENIVLSAKNHGFDVHIFHQFIDEEVNGIFGISGAEESAMGIILLKRFNNKLIRKKTLRNPFNDPSTSIVKKDSYLDVKWYPKLIELNQSSFLEELSTEDILQEPIIENRKKENKNAIIPLITSLDSLPDRDITFAWRNRNSGDSVYLNPSHDHMSFSHFSTIMATCSLTEINQMEHISPYQHIKLILAINSVEGVKPGVYEYDPQNHCLIELIIKPVSIELQKTYVKDNINMNGISFCVFPVVNYQKAFELNANRGYRIVNILGGHLAQRFDIASAGLGYGVRCSDSLNENEANRMLGINYPEQPLMHIIVFNPRTNLTFGNSII